MCEDSVYESCETWSRGRERTNTVVGVEPLSQGLKWREAHVNIMPSPVPAPEKTVSVVHESRLSATWCCGRCFLL